MLSQSFPKVTCQTNPGSIREFSYIPIDEVDEVDWNTLSYIVNSISILPGKSWKTGYSTFTKLQVNEPTTETGNGTLFTPELRGFYPGYNWYLEKLFVHLAAGGRFVLDVTDNNGKRYLLGTKENGLKFTWVYNSQDEPKKLPGYTYRFYMESNQPRLSFYDVDVAPGGGPGGS